MTANEKNLEEKTVREDSCPLTREEIDYILDIYFCKLPGNTSSKSTGTQ
ncbi:hypothetical protein [Agarivorans sp. B2Z047]|nr:hypothetical protein [Agarivorans sp. B2Z047]UQN40955.1 hypothetical protein LQZ07_14355 [Agarivorans sp. B2Z047]